MADFINQYSVIEIHRALWFARYQYCHCECDSCARRVFELWAAALRKTRGAYVECDGTLH